jgi:hypothetical protein
MGPLPGSLRCQRFNTFNHLSPICCASFKTSDGLYHKVRTARDPRILQLGMKLEF